MVADTDKEVRFTRSRQAVLWMVLSAFGALTIFVGVIATLLPSSGGAPELKAYWWAVPILAVWTWFCGRIAYRCLKYAYLIFSPIGVEIFPFGKPEAKLDVVSWGQIDHLEIHGDFLYLHFNKEETGGKAISLKPISPKLRPLIERVVEAHSKGEVSQVK